MTNALPDADELASLMVAVPVDSATTCPQCRSWKLPAFEVCGNCAEMNGGSHGDAVQVIPMGLYSKPSLLRDYLTSYKVAGALNASTAQEALAGIVRAYLTENVQQLRLALGSIDFICPIPSSKVTGAPPSRWHFLTENVHLLPGAIGCLLDRGSGIIAHRVASETAFHVNKDVAGARILLFDDVYTTGAATQSAAMALRRAGAEVYAVLVVARRVNPNYNAYAMNLWLQQIDIPYSWVGALNWLRVPKAGGSRHLLPAEAQD